MSLTLRILGRGHLDNGSPVEFVLHQRGAIIGRAATCDWSLPDPTRFISGRHARILFQDNAYFFEDTSTNGTFLNGATQPLVGVHRIVSGDRLQIGEFHIEAQLSGGAQEAFLNQQASDEAANAAPKWADWEDVPGSLAAPKPTPQPVNPALADNPWGLGGPSSEAVSEWADARDANTGALGADDIFSKFTDQHQVDWTSADWDVGTDYSDPFAFDGGAGAVGGAQTGRTATPFDPPASTSGPVADPFAGPLGNPAVTAPTPAPFSPSPPPSPSSYPATDPFGTLGAPPPAAGGFSAAPVPGQAAPFPPPAPAVPAVSAALPVPTPPVPIPPQPASTSAPAAASIDSSYQELIRAMGIDPGKLKEPSGHTSARAGRALRRLLAGLMVLLEARARAKDQMGASATQLRFDGNNPLKFAPGVDQALEMMLNPPIRGYMEADAAIEDAFRDLQAHQIATLKAMQGALQATLQRFSPSAIKTRTEDKGLLSKVLRSQRDAALWQAYEKEFNGVAQDSAEAFLEVFSKEFRKAYEDASRSP